MLLMTVPAGVSAAHAMPGMSARTETRLIQRAFIRLDGVPLLDGILLALKLSDQSLSLGERVVKPGEGEEASRPEGTSLSPAPPPEGEGSVVLATSTATHRHDPAPALRAPRAPPAHDSHAATTRPTPLGGGGEAGRGRSGFPLRPDFPLPRGEGFHLQTSRTDKHPNLLYNSHQKNLRAFVRAGYCSETIQPGPLPRGEGGEAGRGRGGFPLRRDYPLPRPFPRGGGAACARVSDESRGVFSVSFDSA